MRELKRVAPTHRAGPITGLVGAIAGRLMKPLGYEREHLVPTGVRRQGGITHSLGWSL